MRWSAPYHCATETGATLTIIHVVNQTALNTLHRLLGPQAAAVEQHILDEDRESLAGLTANLGQIHGTSAGIRLTAGAVLRAILEQADAVDADLLVLGARGAGYLRGLLLGTTAERLLRCTLRPMLVVKQTPHEPYRRVLVPVDFSPSSAQALPLARAVAPRAELVLLHAFEAPFESKLRFASIDEETIQRYRMEARREALARLGEIAAASRLRAEAVRMRARHGDASRVILSQEREQGCDLIVVGKHGEGMMEELLLGSVTKHILAKSVCDVLVAERPAPRSGP